MENSHEIVKLLPEHGDKVYKYLEEEFATDEPTFRAFSDVTYGPGWMSKMIRKELRKDLIERPIKSGHSFGVFDAEGELLAIKLGKILYPDKTKR